MADRRVALVTGGSRGIGAAIARRLGADGCAVALTYAASRDKAEAVAAAIGGDAVALAADQGDPGAAAGAVEATVARFGRLDIVVASAGRIGTGLIGDPAADREALDAMVAVNVAGTVALVHAAAARMGEGGRIVLIGSTVAQRVSSRGVADYAASKAALVAYAKGWARDLGPRGITVNLVHPGPIDTDMLPDNGSAYAEQLKTVIALGRFGRPEEIAAAVAFLAGPEASFITGAALNVDGGQVA